MTRPMWAIIIALLIIIGVLAWIFFALPAPGSGPIVSTSTPTTTATSTETGTTSTSTATTTPALHTKVHVTSPLSGSTVSKTFVVKGDAPGTWYFEAVFPIKVLDRNGTVVGQGQGHALSDWMTTAQVPFSATTTVASYTGPATLVLQKDNPSGMPENDDSLSIPITIK